MAEVSQVWMYDRNIIFGKNIDSYFFNEVLEYMDFRSVNAVETDEKKRELKTIDISHPNEARVLVNEDIIERMKKEVEYDIKIRSAVFMSSEYLHESDNKKKIFYANKNKVQNDDFKRFLPRIGQKTNNKFFFQIDLDGVNNSSLKELEKILKQAIKKGYDVQVVVFRGVLEKVNSGRMAYMFDESEMEKLDKINSLCLQITGNELLHQSSPSSVDVKKWKHSAVIKTNFKIDKVAKDIFALGLSPLETITVIHRYVSSFFYNDFNTDPEDPRSLVGLFANEENLPQAICPSLAMLEKTIVDRISKMGFKGLKAELGFYKAFYEDMDKETLHCYDLIQIDDEKYNTHGLYADDPTKDAPSAEAPMSQGYSFCMVPVSDLAKMYKLEQLIDTGIEYENEGTALALSRPYLKTVGLPLAMAKKVFDKEIAKENRKPYQVLSRSGRGRAISYQTMKKAITVSLKKLMPDNKNISNIVAYEIGASMLFAETNFEDNASNCFIKKVNKLSQEEYEVLQKFVFGKIVVDRNGHIIGDDQEDEIEDE